MKRTSRIATLIIVGLALFLPWLLGQAAPTEGTERLQRCATFPPTPAEREADLQSIARFRSFNLNFARRSPTFLVPVQWHVIQEDDGRGDISDLNISEQMQVLNDAYKGRGFSFHLKGTGRTRNSKWRHCERQTPEESEMKHRLGVDTKTTLNLYVTRSKVDLGWATFPWNLAKYPLEDGVVVKDSSLPQRPPTAYGQGDTAVHEVGHWLGLFHTFENQCNPPGDMVGDTPDEYTPFEGSCEQKRRDTCPSAGADPITNYMDYADDSCMDSFTREQVSRMREETGLYRPALASDETKGFLKMVPLQ